MQHRFAKLAAWFVIGSAYTVLPLAPVLASAIFWRRKYIFRYGDTVRRAQKHISAMNQGPALHYFKDVVGQVSLVPDDIGGECIQCGNCCMNHQCMFLEKAGPYKYQCGIYHSPLRRASNCGSFPLHRHDIERYACPSYFLVDTPKTVIPILPASL